MEEKSSSTENSAVNAIKYRFRKSPGTLQRSQRELGGRVYGPGKRLTGKDSRRKKGKIVSSVENARGLFESGRKAAGFQIEHEGSGSTLKARESAISHRLQGGGRTRTSCDQGVRNTE